KEDRSREAARRGDGRPRQAASDPARLVVDAAACRCRVSPHRIRQRQDDEEDVMETVKMSLCPACTACPGVEIAGDEVRIGEAAHGGSCETLRADFNVHAPALLPTGVVLRVVSGLEIHRRYAEPAPAPTSSPPLFLLHAALLI